MAKSLHMRIARCRAPTRWLMRMSVASGGARAIEGPHGIRALRRRRSEVRSARHRRGEDRGGRREGGGGPGTEGLLEVGREAKVGGVDLVPGGPGAVADVVAVALLEEQVRLLEALHVPVDAGRGQLEALAEFLLRDPWPGQD